MKLAWGLAAVAVVVCSVVVARPGAALAQDCREPRLMVVLDKSSSMQTGAIGTQTKWQIAVDALDDVVTEFQSRIELGLMVFPQPDQCSAGEVLVEPALANRDEFLAELAAPPPAAGNYTPIAQTLSAAAADPSLAPSGGARYVVLITDGWQWCSPYDPATRFDAVDTLEDLKAIGVTTYVVGFGGSVDPALLNQLALSAGTEIDGCDPDVADAPCYYQANSPAALVAALMEVAGEVSAETCDGEDNDCDGEVDEGLTRDCASDCGEGTERCEDGAWVGCTAPEPSPNPNNSECPTADEPDEPEPDPEEPSYPRPDGSPAGGCGCRTGGGGGAALGALVLGAFVLAGLRRRRRR